MIGNHVFALLLILVGLLALGAPVAITLTVAALATLLLSMPVEPAVMTIAQRLAGGLDSFALLAIPFFILAGRLMQEGGSARRLVDFAKALVGRLPAGLAHVHVTASMLFGAVSGSAVAAASAIGGVMGPRMEEEGYDRRFTAALNITSATTGLVIPPSNVLIIYSLASGGTSIAALFLAGYLPGFLVGLALMTVSAWLVGRKGELRVVAPEADAGGLRQRGAAALPSLFLLVVVIGGIVGGVFTATEAAAVAVLYAAVLGFAHREIGFGDLPRILREAALTTGVVCFLIAASMALAWVLAYENVPQTVSAALLGLSDQPVVLLLLINLVLLLVGTFLDMTPAVLIFTPIFLPVVVELGMDPVHFGIVMVFNLCIGLCTPPVGTVLFVGCGVAEVRIVDVLRPLIPFWLAMIAALAAITFVPQLSLWLPSVWLLSVWSPL